MVITILALFAAAIMPNVVQDKRSREIRQFFPAARNLMLTTRSRSIGDGITRTIRIDDSAHRVIVERTDATSGDVTEDRSLGIPSGVTTNAFRLEKDDSNAADWKIGFYADGRSEGGAVEFNADGKSISILIEPSGSVKVEDGKLPDISNQEWDAGGYEQRI